MMQLKREKKKLSVCRSAGLGAASGRRFVPGLAQNAVVSDRHQGPAEVDGREDEGRGRTPSAPAAGEDAGGSGFIPEPSSRSVVFKSSFFRLCPQSWTPSARR